MYATLTYAKSSKTCHFKNIQHACSESQPVLDTRFTKEDFLSHLKKSRKDSAFCHPRATSVSKEITSVAIKHCVYLPRLSRPFLYLQSWFTFQYSYLFFPVFWKIYKDWLLEHAALCKIFNQSL